MRRFCGVVLVGCVILGWVGCGGGGGGGGSQAITAPQITSQPQSIKVLAGTPATFSITASGTGLSYQWKKNGTALPGATSSTFQIASTTVSDGGDYAVTVSNSAGSATSASAALTVASFLLSPDRSYLPVGRNLRLEVLGSGTEALVWTIVETGSGTLQVDGGGGRAATYSAPAAPGTFTVRIASTSPAQAETAQINVVSLTSATNLGVTLSPLRVQTTTTLAQAALLKARFGFGEKQANFLAQAQAQVQFKGKGRGTKEVIKDPPDDVTGLAASAAEPELIWWVLEGPAGGTIDAFGIYTPPATPGVFHVAVARADDTKLFALAEVEVTQATEGAQVLVHPSPATLIAGEQIYLTAAVNPATNQAVVWSLEEGPEAGTLTPAAGTDPNQQLYTAPTTAGVYHARATSVEDATLSGLGFLNVVPLPELNLTPASIQLTTGEKLTFLATGPNGPVGSLQWSISEGSPQGGTLAPGVASALYTAPAVPGLYHLQVRSVADSSVAATAIVKVTGATAPVTVTLAPATIRLAPGTVAPFTVSVTGSTNQAVLWSTTGGAIDASGLYTAPAVPGVYTVTAVAVADASRSASASVTVANLPAFTSIPPLVGYINAPYTYALTLRHPASLPMTLALQESPAGATLAGSHLSWTPNSSQVGRIAFVVRATDSQGASTTQSWTVDARGVGIHLVAGALGGDGYREGTGYLARFSNGIRIALDPATQTLALTDTGNRLVRRVTLSGTTSLFAGDRSGGDADGTGPAARFAFPDGIATDAAGTIYVMDRGAAKVKKITPTGVVTTVANRSGRYLAAGASNNLYVTRIDGTALYQVTQAGVSSTFVGNPGVQGYLNGVGTAALFRGIAGIASDAAGNLYVTDNGNKVIRKIDPGGTVTTLAGQPGVVGAADGTGAGATFTSIGAITSDAVGNLCVHDSGAIRKVSSAGVVTTWLGTVGTAGHLDLPGTNARFDAVSSLTLGPDGTLYCSDGPKIRKVTPAGLVSTIAGSIPNFGLIDGVGGNARLNGDRSLLQGMRLGPNGNLYIVDGKALRKVSMDGTVTTFPASLGAFAYGVYLALDGNGNAYIADDDTIKKVTSTGEVTTLAGTPGPSSSRTQTDGVGAAARFGALQGIVAAPGGSILYVLDNRYFGVTGMAKVRAVTSGGVVTTLAPFTDAFRYGAALGMDPAGNLLLGEYQDFQGRRLLKGPVTGPLISVAGSDTENGFVDGPGPTARFQFINDVTTDPQGNVFLADLYNFAIRKITPSGQVSTVAGGPAVGAVQLGPLTGSLSNIWALERTPEGHFLISCENCILRIVPEP